MLTVYHGALARHKCGISDMENHAMICHATQMKYSEVGSLSGASGVSPPPHCWTPMGKNQQIARDGFVGEFHKDLRIS